MRSEQIRPPGDQTSWPRCGESQTEEEWRSEKVQKGQSNETTKKKKKKSEG